MLIKKKKSLTDNITFHSTFLLLVTIVIMILIIVFFTSLSINNGIEYRLYRSGRVYSSKIKMDYDDIVSCDELNEDDIEGIEHVILDRNRQIVYGTYTEESLAETEISYGITRKIKAGNSYYYIMDYLVEVEDASLNNHSRYFIVRSFIKENELRAKYSAIISIGIFVIIFMIIAYAVITIFMIRRMEKPIDNLCSMAEQIGQDEDLSKRIEIDEDSFTEIQTLTKANNRMLDHAEKLLDAHRQFSSDVAHELKTPISVIIAQCQYSSRYLTDSQEVVESFGLIEEQARKTNEIITKLFEVTKLEYKQVELQLEKVDFSEIVDTVCDSELKGQQKNIVINKDFQQCEGYFDINLITIAIRNIISNAIKFSPANSEVDLIVKPEKNLIIFECQDYGCGMSQEEMKHIFYRFYRSDRSRNSEGFGLGLTLTKNIVEIHKGKILVSSSIDEGSLFRVELPLNNNIK